MGSTELWSAPDVVPELGYRDLGHAIDWLHRAYGFRERADARLTWPGGGRAWLEIGQGLVALFADGDMPPPTARTAKHAVVVKVYVDDVDAHFARAEAAGATIVSTLQDGFWGGRKYRTTDLGGHLWEISQRGRDLPADRWQLPPGTTRGTGR